MRSQVLPISRAEVTLFVLLPMPDSGRKLSFLKHFPPVFVNSILPLQGGNRLQAEFDELAQTLRDKA